MSTSVTPRRRAFAVNAKTGPELVAGRQDVLKVFTLLTDPALGACVDDGSILLHDCASRQQFDESLNLFLYNWSLQDQLIFYYTGHGETRNTHYSLVLGDQFYPFRSFLNELEFAGVKRAIIVLDACHSGAATAVKSVDFLEKSLPQGEDLPLGTAILASSGATQMSEEIPEETISVFTKIFCEGISTGLNNMSTPDNKIGVDDMLDFVNRTLERPEYLAYPQRPVLTTRQADRSIWIAKNNSVPESNLASFVHAETPNSQIYELLYHSTSIQERPCLSMPSDRIGELDWDLIRAYATQTERRFDETQSQWQEDLLSRLRLFSSISPDGGKYLTKAAVLCFHEKPQDMYPNSSVVFVRNREFVRISIDGPLYTQFARLQAIIREHVPWESTIGTDGIRRDNPVFDLAVVREVISNAIAHRDYDSASGSEVVVSLEDNYIEIKSPGRFPEGLSWNALISPSRSGGRPRAVNEFIARYISSLGVLEKAGRGFPIFRKYVKTYGPDSIECQQEFDNVIIRIKRLPAVESTLIQPPKAVSGIAERYMIDSELGRGGFGVVYLARDELLGRNVALKVLHPSLSLDPGAIRLFSQEAGFLAKLEHDNILPIYDTGESDGYRYIVMRFVQGRSLAHVLREEGPQPVERVATWFAQIAAGLDFAHAQDVLHRDIKLSNLLLDGIQDRILISDFGLARALSDSGSSSIGRQPMAGSVPYMAPEVLEGSVATEASDLYSLGCVLYELLTGRPPFTGDTALSVMFQHVQSPVPALELPGSKGKMLARQVEALLAKDPADRPTSAGAATKLP